MYEETKTEKPPWRWKIRVCWQRRRVLFTFYASDFGAWETTTCRILTRRCHALAPYVAYNLNTRGHVPDSVAHVCVRALTCWKHIPAHAWMCPCQQWSTTAFHLITAGPACFSPPGAIWQLPVEWTLCSRLNRGGSQLRHGIYFEHLKTLQALTKKLACMFSVRSYYTTVNRPGSPNRLKYSEL